MPKCSHFASTFVSCSFIFFRRTTEVSFINYDKLKHLLLENDVQAQVALRPSRLLVGPASPTRAPAASRRPGLRASRARSGNDLPKGTRLGQPGLSLPRWLAPPHGPGPPAPRPRLALSAAGAACVCRAEFMRVKKSVRTFSAERYPPPSRCRKRCCRSRTVRGKQAGSRSAAQGQAAQCPQVPRSELRPPPRSGTP